MKNKKTKRRLKRVTNEQLIGIGIMLDYSIDALLDARRKYKELVNWKDLKKEFNNGGKK